MAVALYSQFGFTKTNPPRSTYTYASEILRRQRRRILIEAVVLLLMGLIGIGLLMIPMIAVTPR